MKSLYRFVLLAILLVSCSIAPSENALQTAIDRTQIAQPTNTLSANLTATKIPTLTPNPMTDLDLESIIIRPGDLPEGYTGEQFMDSIPGYIDLQGAVCRDGVYQEFQ